ncbi:MAG: tRNA lysidine(34) synthetase TilS [Anaerolineales bacterium]
MIGVSGGPDSMCLLDLMHRSGYALIVAHMNHALRETADEEASLVALQASSRRLPYVTQTIDIREYSVRHKLTVEEAARTARYRFLFAQARQYGAQAVAVAHTADDQVETVLMHLLRGAGLAGLTGMDYSSVISAFDKRIPLVRPLLGFWREEITTYLAERGLVATIDESNWDIRYHRNRLRHELLPILEGYNPNIRRTIYRMAEILRGEQEIIEDAVRAAFEACLLTQGSDYIIFSAVRLRSQPVGIRRHLLRRGIDILRPGLRDVDFQSVDRGLAALQSEATREIELLEGLYIILEEDRFVLASRQASLPVSAWPQITEGESYPFTVPGECELPNGWQLVSEIVEANGAVWQAARHNPDPFQAWLDADAVKSPIVVRRRSLGDRFYPLGMDGHSVKLSDFMINNKIPKRARDGWPLLVSDGEIIWVPGYRQAHHTRLQPDSRKVVCLKLSQN